MKITDEMVSKAIEAGEMIGWDFIEDRMRDALTAALPHLDSVDVAAVRRQAFEEALHAIAHLPTAENIEIMVGHEDAYRAVEALSAEPALKGQQHDK